MGVTGIPSNDMKNARTERLNELSIKATSTNKGYKYAVGNKVYDRNGTVAYNRAKKINVTPNPPTPASANPGG